MASLANWVSSQLTDDLMWREAELALMRKHLHASALGSPQEGVLLRANVAMLYAHYEGFCKYALELYQDSVSKLKIRRGDLCWPLLTYSLGKFQSALKNEPDRRDFFAKVLVDFNGMLDAVATYDEFPEISNLWPDLLCEWLARFGLGQDEVTENSALLKSLVMERNQIAHGKRLMISDRMKFDKYSRAATIAMHSVAVGIVESFEVQSYRRVGVLGVTINTRP